MSERLFEHLQAQLHVGLAHLTPSKQPRTKKCTVQTVQHRASTPCESHLLKTAQNCTCTHTCAKLHLVTLALAHTCTKLQAQLYVAQAPGLQHAAALAHAEALAAQVAERAQHAPEHAQHAKQAPGQQMAASQRQVPLLQQQQLQEQQLQMDAQQQQALQRVQQQHVQVTRRTGMAVCSGNKEDGDVWV